MHPDARMQMALKEVLLCLYCIAISPGRLSDVNPKENNKQTFYIRRRMSHLLCIGGNGSRGLCRYLGMGMSLK